MKVNVINMLRQAGDELQRRGEGGYAYGLHELANNMLVVMQGRATWEEFCRVYVAGQCQPLDLDKHLPVPAEGGDDDGEEEGDSDALV